MTSRFGPSLIQDRAASPCPSCLKCSRGRRGVTKGGSKSGATLAAAGISGHAGVRARPQGTYPASNGRVRRGDTIHHPLKDRSRLALGAPSGWSC